MNGRLQRIHIDGLFASNEDANLAARLTKHESDFGRDMWRRVTTHGNTEVIVGWASIEHPDYQTDEACQSTDDIYAFYIMRTARNWTERLGFPLWMDDQPAFQVLYLKRRNVGNYYPCFERLGFGRLFGNDIELSFRVWRGATYRFRRYSKNNG